MNYLRVLFFFFFFFQFVLQAIVLIMYTYTQKIQNYSHTITLKLYAPIQDKECENRLKHYLASLFIHWYALNSYKFINIISCNHILGIGGPWLEAEADYKINFLSSSANKKQKYKCRTKQDKQAAILKFTQGTKINFMITIYVLPGAIWIMTNPLE